MTTGGGQIIAADPGLITLVTLLRFLGIGADPEQIRHRFGGSPVGVPEMLRVASEFGLKARARKTAWSRLPNSPLPAIAALKDGGFMFLGKAGEDTVEINPGERSVLSYILSPIMRYKHETLRER